MSPQVRNGVPIVYAIVVVVVAITTRGPVVGIVAFVGAMLVGLFYVVTSGHVEGGRQRNRNRHA